MDDATLIVLSNEKPTPAVVAALRASAERLGYDCGCAFATLPEALAEGSEHPLPEGAPLAAALGMFIRMRDPWAVVAIDEPSIEVLRAAFAEHSAALAPDAPAEAFGYTLVAVPAFGECVGDGANQQAKRVAWQRLKAARHPGNPLG